MLRVMVKCRSAKGLCVRIAVRLYYYCRASTTRLVVPVPLAVAIQPPGLGSMYWQWCAVVLLLCVP